MASDEIFPGFPACLEDGYTQMPNAWFEILMSINNVAELKVVLYVIRNTWGYRDEDGDHETMKKITVDEFAYGRKRRDGSRIDRGTGLGITAVKDGIKRALDHQYIICEIDDSDLARIEKSYGLKMLEEEDEEADNFESHNPTIDSRNPTTSSQNATANGHNPTSDGPKGDYRSEKETSETNSSKETMRNMPHSQFFDETLAFIKKKEVVTFYQLERYLHRFMKVRGQNNINLKVKNVVVWTGVTQEFLDMILELQADHEHINLSFVDEQLYGKGRKPRLPVTYKDGDHEELHWRPMIIKHNK